MGTRRATAPAAFIAFLIIALLFSALSAIGTHAQSGSPPPATGQVIAHGIDTLPGTPVNWRLGLVTAQPGTDALFGSFDTGFAIGYQDPVITTQLPSGQSHYLDPGAAIFHASGDTLRVSSASTVDVGFLYIDLTALSTDPGASFIGDGFTPPSGTHDVRLTSDVMQAGETGSFIPEGAHPYLLYVFDGTLEVTQENGSVTSAVEGDAVQLTGDAVFTTGATAGAHWMIASIGPQVTVPPLPTFVTPAAGTPAGSMVIQLLRCPDGTDPLFAPTECVISDTVWDITLAPQGGTDPASERTLVGDSVDIGNTSYRFTDLAPGTWVVMPDMSGMTPEQRIEITGDTVPLGGIWGVTIVANQESEIYVYLIDPQISTGTGDLIIEMYDCPPGVDPLGDSTTCAFATDVPNVEVSRITQSEMIVYNTATDAVQPDIGTFILEDIQAGLYLIIPEDGGLWSANAIQMGGDAVWDNGFWEVTIPADGGSAYVAIYHTPAGPPEPPAGPGRVIIEQIDCPSGTTDPVSDPACTWSTAPWDVIAENNDTGETWSLYANAAQTGDGTWTLELPEGAYTVYVEVDPGWDVMINGGTETSIQVSVTADGESYLSIFSTAP